MKSHQFGEQGIQNITTLGILLPALCSFRIQYQRYCILVQRALD